MRISTTSFFSQILYSARRWSVLGVGLLAFALVLVGCDSGGGGGGGDSLDGPSLADRLSEEGNLGTFVTALEETGQNESLKNASLKYVIFAPTNDAFNNAVGFDLSFLQGKRNAYTSVVRDHKVVGDEIKVDTLEDGDVLETVRGTELEVSFNNGDITGVEGASVTSSNEVENGKYYVVDEMLLTARNMAERLQVSGEASTLSDAIEAAGLAGVLSDKGTTTTVFAPTNSAFQNAKAFDFDYLSENPDILASVLQDHLFVGGVFAASDVPSMGDTTLTTPRGDELTVGTDGNGNVVVEGAQLTTADVRASNGTAHFIDEVLLNVRSAAERLQVSGEVSTLSAAIEAIGGASLLDDEDNTYTIFAPVNSTFELYDTGADESLLNAVLGGHIVQGDAFTSSQLSDGDQLQTLQGDNLDVTVSGGNISVDGAQVTTADVEAANAQIHFIDEVILNNRNLAQRLQFTSATEELYSAIDGAGLRSAFADSDNDWTTFAPNNEAFENADLSGFSDSEVQEILQYHVLDGVTDSGALQNQLSQNGGEITVETIQGEDVTITDQGDAIVFNDGAATLNLDRVDQRASNGIIHLIDGVLVPPSLSSNN